MKNTIWLIPLMQCALCFGTLSASAADALKPADFAWQATLTVPAGATVARVSLPAQAMVKLQTNNARDVRVFNAAGDPLAFALLSPAGTKANPMQTGYYAAHALHSAQQGQIKRPGALAVEINGASQTVWVKFDDKANQTAVTPDANALDSVLFDTRLEKQPISEMILQAALPTNTLIHFALESSADLKQWTPIALQGPLFRFDGVNAPRSDVLTLTHSERLEGRYLRLSWEGQDGVQVSGFTGQVAPTQIAPKRPRINLPVGQQDGTTAMIWQLDFATPVAALHLSTARENTLVPVRILVRNDAAQPWRYMAQAVVYRVGAAGQVKINPKLPLGGAAFRQFRVESINAMALPGNDLHAAIEFEPLDLLFLASGPGPFDLAVGRAGAPAANVTPSLLTAVTTGPIESLPVAEIGLTRIVDNAFDQTTLGKFLTNGDQQRNAMLWVVLIAGVLVLAGVAYVLLRKLSHPTT